MRKELFKKVKRIVVKIGSGVLTSEESGIDPVFLQGLAAQVAELSLAGKEVVIVSSGAVAAGTLPSAILFMAAFGLGTTPTMLAISLSGRLLPLHLRTRLRSTIPIGVCLLAGLLILRGMSLGIPYVSPVLTGPNPVCCHAP